MAADRLIGLSGKNSKENTMTDNKFSSFFANVGQLSAENALLERSNAPGGISAPFEQSEQDEGEGGDGGG